MGEIDLYQTNKTQQYANRVDNYWGELYNKFALNHGHIRSMQRHRYDMNQIIIKITVAATGDPLHNLTELHTT